ncbi:barstar family protein [Nocardiopsis baichengensis]|uniref:barstar family protein n=1 Tax=Nocardiopsis baichengensis TaxID=280240 RepID=UPI00035E0A17|nr:barstar family protein [Nocardiopsis baichengensis]
MIVDLTDEDVQPNALAVVKDGISLISQGRDGPILVPQRELHVTDWAEFVRDFPADAPGIEEALTEARRIPWATVSLTDTHSEIEATIDVGYVSSSHRLHMILKLALGFPDMYGHNWNAFWDAITGLVPIPGRIRLCGWSELVETLPDDAHLLHEQFLRYQEEQPGKLYVEYVD